MNQEIKQREETERARPLGSADVRDHIREYCKLLDERCAESTLHRFLANHSYFFNPLRRSGGLSPVYSKVRLGDEFEVDFVCFDPGSNGPEWYLIEIEPPKYKMFTRAGNPSAALTHAMQQVRNWISWIGENLQSARNLMPYIEYPLGYVFLGRRTDLDGATRSKLRRLCFDNRTVLRIHSLDWFVDMPKSILASLEQHPGTTRTLPTRALSHRQLRKGLPSTARSYMDGFVAGLVRSDVYPKEMMEDRHHDRWPYGEGI